jgi:small-conductance mechanosensitive channel
MPSDWISGLRDTAQKVYAFLPALLGAGLLVLAGWLLGRLLAWLARRAGRAVIGRLTRQPSLHAAIESSGAGEQVPAVIGGFVFWVVLIFFVATAMETLGLPVVTASLSRVAYYLPNVLAALVVIFAGLIVGKVVGNAVARTATGTGMAFGPAIGATVRGTVILVAAVVAIEQVGIQADLLVVMLAVIVGAGLAGAGLAFGLGARTAVSNIIASHYVSQAYRVGQTVRVAGVEGQIVQTTPTAVFIAAAEGRVLVPASRFSESASVLLTEPRQ